MNIIVVVKPGRASFEKYFLGNFNVNGKIFFHPVL